MSVKRGAEDEKKQQEEAILKVPSVESLTISTTVSTAPAAIDGVMHTPDF